MGSCKNILSVISTPESIKKFDDYFKRGERPFDEISLYLSPDYSLDNLSRVEPNQVISSAFLSAWGTLDDLEMESKKEYPYMTIYQFRTTFPSPKLAIEIASKIFPEIVFVLDFIDGEYKECGSYIIRRGSVEKENVPENVEEMINHLVDRFQHEKDYCPSCSRDSAVKETPESGICCFFCEQSIDQKDSGPNYSMLLY